MGGLQRVGDLEIAHDEAFQRREFALARVALAALTVVVIATLLGLLGGSGVLSDSEASNDEGMTVGYERFARLGAGTELELGLVSAGADLTKVAIKSAYLEGFQVDGVTPTPDSVTAQPDRLVYTFDQDPPATVTLYLTPSEIGLQKATIRAGSGEPVEFTQFVYP